MNPSSDTLNQSLYRALNSGDLETTKRILDRQPDALNASLSANGDTALHIAVLAGRVKVVEELVKRIDKKDLGNKTKDGDTALTLAAIGGITKIAEYLVKKSPELLSFPDKKGRIPIVKASQYGHKDMTRYLYSVTPMEELNPERSQNGVTLATICISLELYDIVLDLIRQHGELAYAVDTHRVSSMTMLARKPFAFPSGSHLPIWKKLIYSCIPIGYSPTFNSRTGDIETSHIEGQAEHQNAIIRVWNRLKPVVWKSLRHFAPVIDHLYKLKCTHLECLELLGCICREIMKLEESQLPKVQVEDMLSTAVDNGIVEIIAEIMKHYPDTTWLSRSHYYTLRIFLRATLRRQEKNFSLIDKMGAEKTAITTFLDNKGNNILHQAAYFSPSSNYLDRISGPALQMQRELQWFKEVESIVQPIYRLFINDQIKTPQVLFTEQHKNLVKEGEAWMKKTAESCTIVATLIVTIMFTAVFTVPGGYNQNTGVPIYLHQNSFLVFIISDTVSLLSSCNSLLMLLGLLTTARYREEDFLKSLPTKLIIGLSTLFFSIAAMMITFGAALVIILRERVSWVAIPITLLVSFPVTLYALLYFPLLIEMLYSTYGPGMFDRPKKISD